MPPCRLAVTRTTSATAVRRFALSNGRASVRSTRSAVIAAIREVSSMLLLPRRRRLRLGAFLLFCAAAIPAWADPSLGPRPDVAPPPPPPPAAVVALAERLEGLVAPVAARAAVGICVRPLDRDQELYARNADPAFVPP